MAAGAPTGDVAVAIPVAADCGDTEVSADTAGVGSCATRGYVVGSRVGMGLGEYPSMAMVMAALCGRIMLCSRYGVMPEEGRKARLDCGMPS